MDTITLKGIEAIGYHGALDFEREHGQPFVVDVVLGVDRLGDSDELAETVNYAEVAEMVTKVVSGKPFRLIESVAAAIADQALEHSLVRTVSVTVHKPRAPLPHTIADTSTTINRSR